MDHLTYIKDNIASRTDRLAKLDQERVVLVAEIGAFNQMLDAFNGTTAMAAAKELRTSSSSFTMSKEWVAVFTALDKRGRSFDANDVERIGALTGVQLTIQSIRSQFAHYVKSGHLRKVSRGKYMITQKGREKFAAAEASLGDSSKENGPPEGSPETREVSASRPVVVPIHPAIRGTGEA